MNDLSDETDRRLARLFASRDPGDAPRTLRDRVAAIPRVSPPTGSRWTRTLLPLRPAAAILGTAAAVVVGFVAISALRSSSSRGPAGPGTTITLPGQAPDLHTAGFVPALQIWFVVAVVLTGLLVVALGLERTPNGLIPGIAAHPPQGLSWIGTPVARRFVLLGMAAVVGIGGYEASSVDALTRGTTWRPSSEHYLGSMPGYGGDRAIAFFTDVAGTTIAFSQTIANQAAVPVTILGGDPARPWLELRIFAEAPGQAPIDVAPSYPFAPIEIAPGEERQILFVVHIARPQDCATARFGPVPSPEPTPDAAGRFIPPASGNGGALSFDPIQLHYSILGLERTASVEMDPIPVLYSFGDGSCGFDFDWATRSPTPSGP